MHGIGKMTHKDGRVCKGIWENGKIVYEGELNENGKPHGRGKWTYSDSVNGREERSVVSLKTFILSGSRLASKSTTRTMKSNRTQT